MISLDTETTGIDLYHGARPFFVTTCDGAGEQQFWEWDVDPLTREPLTPAEDIKEISCLMDEVDELVCQNGKFDCAALATLGLPSGGWPWDKTHDTLIASHVLASNRPHDLTSLAIQYVGWDIKPFEDALEVEVQKCRRWCRSHLPEWRLAKKDLPDMPSAGEKTWKYDTWLPRALVKHLWQSSEAGMYWAKGYPGVSKKVDGIFKKLLVKDNLVGKCTQMPGWEYAPPGVSDKPHPWWTVLRDYANADSAATVEIWKEQAKELHRRGLWDIYLARRQVMGIAHRMESRGVTLSKGRLTNLTREYVQEAAHSAEVCRGIAALHEYDCQRCAAAKVKAQSGKKQKELPGLCPVCNGTGRAPYDLELPRGGVNESLRTFIFNVLKLPPITNKKARTDRPTLNAGAVEYYLQTLPVRSMEHLFISKLVEKRRRDTAVSYMKGYARFWLPYTPAGGGFKDATGGALAPGWFVLHPSLNPTGTDTLRWSSSHPNEQNISKKEGFNLRYCFGPAPGREWWSLDAKNIELRIPAYESGEQDFIALFEKPDDPPYFGSNHLLIAHLLHKEAFEECWSCSRCGKEVWVLASGKRQEGKFCECRVSSRILDGRVFKKRYASTRYQRTKNGNFACVPMDTEALTKEGWKTYDQIVEGDLVLGYLDGYLQWTPVLGKVNYNDAELVRLSNNHFTACTTLDHRWLGTRRTGRGRTRRTVEEVFTSGGVKTEHTITLSHPTKDVSELDLTDDESAIIGFVYGDGHIEKSLKGPGPSRGLRGEKVGFRVKLFQSKPEGIKYVDSLLARWGKPFKRRVGGGLTVWVLNPDAARSIWRRAGLWETQDFERLVIEMGPTQRSAFLEGVFAAEGSLDGRGHIRLYTQNQGPFAEGIRLAIFLTGRFPTETEKKDYYGSGHTCLEIRESKPHVTGQRLHTELLSGTHSVWCLQTQLGSWVMRQGRQIMLTGNCLYGAVDRADGQGTADRTYGIPGAQSKIKVRFAKMEALNQKWIAFARKHGYVETMPSKAINPKRGYPIMCSRTEYGEIKPTVPLNYHVQSTAMEWMQSAMIRCDRLLQKWNKCEGVADGRLVPVDAMPPSRSYYIILQVHDELVFDFPQERTVGKGPDGKEVVTYGNLWRVREIQRLMEQGGEDIGVPTPVSCSYHAVSWAEGVDL